MASPKVSNLKSSEFRGRGKSVHLSSMSPWLSFLFRPKRLDLKSISPTRWGGVGALRVPYTYTTKLPYATRKHHSQFCIHRIQNFSLHLFIAGSMSNYIKAFTVIPKELFRWNRGTKNPSSCPTPVLISRHGSFDLLTEAVEWLSRRLLQSRDR